jgi:hypothetical protein
MEAALAARATPLNRGKLLETVPPEMLAPPSLPVSFASRRIDPPAPPEYGATYAAELGDGEAADVLAGAGVEVAADGTVIEDAAPGAAAGVPLPDVAGLPARIAVRRLHGLGFRVRHEGAGPIEGTFPAAGTRLQPGDTVILVVRRRTDD